MHRHRTWYLCVLILLLGAPIVLAQTTGSISGVARDSAGAPLPGVLVSISGPPMPLGRTATTRSDGTFQFLNLIPGTYQLRAELQGLGAFQQEVQVSAIKNTEVRPVLQPTAQETVTVTAATPIVDTRSSDVSTVQKRATLERLPLVRTFSGTFQLAPGVADSGVAITNTNVGVNAGGGRQDNTYFYDGVNVTNPFFGDIYQDFAELDIQEVSFTRGGVTPEFGRTGGFIVNGVTKSGTNNLHGEARLEYQPTSFEADSVDATNASKSSRFRPGAGFGGPILPDHLFGYGSVNFLRQDIQDRTNLTGSLPDSNFNINEYFAKLSATPSTQHLIDASFRYRGIDQDNADIDVDSTASTGDTSKEISRVGVFNWFFMATPNASVEFKFNYNDNPGYTIPTVAIPFQPPFNAANPAAVGYFCTGGLCDGVSSLRNNIDNFRRLEYKLTGSYTATLLGANHLFKVGGYYSDNKEDKLTLANGWGSITINNNSSNCLGADSCYRARFNPDQPAQISRGRTIGVFAQDQATWNRLTLNIGVLVNQDQFIPNDNGQFTILHGDPAVQNSDLLPCSDPNHDPRACTTQSTYIFPFSKQWQPRVGLAYEVDTSVHDKAYVNYARYDNMDNQSFARSAAPIRLYRTDAFFDLQTGAFLQQFTRSNNTGKVVLANIDPTYTDEFVAGYSRPLPKGWSIELWGMFRQTKGVFEDFPSDKSNVDSDFRYGNIPAFRKYKAGTIQIRKAFNDNWQLDVSYTYSRLTGNWDLDYATQLFYTSSYIEDGPGLYVEDPNRKGVLIGNRTHVAKFFGSYLLPTNTLIGGFLRVQSGRPWEARLFDPSYGTDYEYAETAGKRTTPMWTNLDLLVAQNIPLGGAMNLRLEGRLLNVANTQTVLTVDQDLFLSDDNTDPNPRFGQGTSFAPPRRFILSAIFSF